ncbi:hypothetical protein MU898_004638 [Salmonella enterica]|nr:hypothetical protein [Salmonella enterica]
MVNVPAKPRNTKGEPPSQADTEHGFNPTRKSADGRKAQLNLYIDMELKREFRSIAAANDMKHGELFEAYQEFWKKHH